MKVLLCYCLLFIIQGALSPLLSHSCREWVSASAELSSLPHESCGNHVLMPKLKCCIFSKDTRGLQASSMQWAWLARLLCFLREDVLCWVMIFSLAWRRVFQVSRAPIYVLPRYVFYLNHIILIPSHN